LELKKKKKRRKEEEEEEEEKKRKRNERTAKYWVQGPGPLSGACLKPIFDLTLLSHHQFPKENPGKVKVHTIVDRSCH